MGLTSGSTHWLMSRASGQAAAAGLRLGRKPHSRDGHVWAPDPYSCRGLLGLGALPGPGTYSEGPGAYPRDPACPLGSSGPVVQGSDVLPRRSGPIDAPWGVLSFLATWCSQPCPCGGVRCCFPCDPGASHGCGVFILQKGIPLSQGKDSGPRAHLRGGFEPVGGAKIYTLRSHSMTRAKICQLATGHTNRRAGFHGQPTHGPHAWRFSHAPHAWGALLALPMLRISSGGGPEATWERARWFASPAHGGQCLSHVTRGPEPLCQ
jgi:hypothetical protein